ncbi:MAG: cell division protein FtsQ/DivIB [Acetatifactor sp.]
MYKRKKAGIIALTILVLGAVVLGAGWYFKSKYTIKNVYVEDNIHYTDEEIKAFVMKGALGNNSKYLSLKYRNREVEDIPFVDTIDVDILSADTIRIRVYEKPVIGYVRYLGTNMYFDKDGYVVESNDVITRGIPQVTGITFDHMARGEKLQVENEEVFDRILVLKNILDKNELYADKVNITSRGEITVYFENLEVMLGNDSAVLENKIAQLKGILQKYEGQAGTLKMTTYNEEGRYSFNPK